MFPLYRFRRELTSDYSPLICRYVRRKQTLPNISLPEYTPDGQGQTKTTSSLVFDRDEQRITFK